MWKSKQYYSKPQTPGWSSNFQHYPDMVNFPIPKVECEISTFDAYLSKLLDETRTFSNIHRPRHHKRPNGCPVCQ